MPCAHMEVGDSFVELVLLPSLGISGVKVVRLLQQGFNTVSHLAGPLNIGN